MYLHVSNGCLFGTVISVEDGGDHCFKPSSNMKHILFLITIWYAKRSSERGAALFQQYCISYTSLLLLIMCPHLFILEETKPQVIALSISFHCFLWTFLLSWFLDFFDPGAAFGFYLLRSSETWTVLYTVLVMPFFSASLTSGNSFPLKLNPSSSLTLNSAKEQSQFQRVAHSLTDVLACRYIIFPTVLGALSQNVGNDRMFFCHPACKAMVSGGHTSSCWRWTLENYPETPSLY